MTRNEEFARSQLRFVKRFAIVWPFIVAAIAGTNIWHDANQGNPFDWTNVFASVAMILFGWLVCVFCWAIIKFVLAMIRHRGEQ